MDELNGMIEETISGQRIVKAFSQEDRVMEEFAEKSDRLRRTGFWALTYSGFIPKVMNMLNNAGFAIVAGVGGLLGTKRGWNCHDWDNRHFLGVCAPVHTSAQ